jgi:hypothetical protein
MQTTLPVVMALTYPGSRIAEAGIRGVLDEYNRWSVLVPIVTIFSTGLLNWAYFLPATNTVTAKRRLQGMLGSFTAMETVGKGERTTTDRRRYEEDTC